MKVAVPQDEVHDFASLLETDRYRSEERDYKVAVHIVISSLYSDANRQREDFGELIADLFGEPFPDMGSLGIPATEQQFVRAAMGPGTGGLRSALANLAGGKWGLAQFSWLPRAVEYGLGKEVGDAFRVLVDEDLPLAERIEKLRDDLDAVSVALESKGGFLPNWQHFRTSLAFIAVLLAGYDPARYTFYSQGALLHAYQQYGLDLEWPKGSRGSVYEQVCAFVRAIADDLRAKGAPVQDLIDAQSFIWMTFSKAKEARAGVPHPVSDGTEGIKKPTGDVDIETITRELAAVAYWPLERAAQLLSLVQRSQQVIFHGPPGTGKTYIAETLARLLVGEEEGHVEVVQFHPSYAYEDFVEGIRPRVTEGSGLAYEVRKGVFMRLVDEAKQNPGEQFVLIIDELNRANLPRVLGELLYALEYRGTEHAFRLPYSGMETYIPHNITLIGTMNTADRSIALVDAAIRRRFRHFRFDPDVEVLKAWLVDHGGASIASTAAARLEALNDELMELLDEDRLIGHSYLMRENLAEHDFSAVWDEDIEPVLSEHLFSTRDEVIRLRSAFTGSG